MTLEEVSCLMPGDKIFAYVTSKMDIFNLEIVIINYNSNKIICKNNIEHYTIPYYLYDGVGRTFEECLYNSLKNYKVIRKSNLKEKYGNKFPEYFI